MRKFLKPFLTEDAGAVSVDWVVLTAGVCGLALSTILIMNNGPVNVGTALGAYLSASVSP